MLMNIWFFLLKLYKHVGNFGISNAKSNFRFPLIPEGTYKFEYWIQKYFFENLRIFSILIWFHLFAEILLNSECHNAFETTKFGITFTFLKKKMEERTTIFLFFSFFYFHFYLFICCKCVWIFYEIFCLFLLNFV